VFRILYKISRRVRRVLGDIYCTIVTYFHLLGNGATFNDFKTTGTPHITVSQSGSLALGKGFKMNNGIRGNPIGNFDRCTLYVGNFATLSIGNNVGISQTALICHKEITIGSDVKIGGGTKIFDTDFHSLDPHIRKSKNDTREKASAPVLIKDGVFIGANCLILKGVIVGYNSVVGAGSVVSKSIPDNQIWAGNPAKFIREIPNA
jgi:acetyltransferase-like isoleucine patch superfamily enzyme